MAKATANKIILELTYEEAQFLVTMHSRMDFRCPGYKITSALKDAGVTSDRELILKGPSQVDRARDIDVITWG